MADRIIQRNDTLENWNSVNPVLALGELAIITNTGGYKIGDGINTFKDLPYPQNPTQIADELGNSSSIAISQRLVTEKFNELTNMHQVLTEDEYEALEDKKDNTFYYTYEEDEN